MSIMTQLEFELDFSQSEKNIARYILEHGEAILNLTIKELASKTYTSPATIVRLCRKIGLEGFQDFKIKYSAELQYENNHRIDVNFPFSKLDSTLQIVGKMAQLHQEAIQDTLNLIDVDNLNKIVSIINKANKVYLFGYGNSLLAGLDFQHKMMRINKLVEIRPNSGEQGFLSYTCQKDDVAIIISYSGETNEMIDIAKLLKRKHIVVIAITSIGENRLSAYSDYLINTGSREKIFSKIAPFASKTSISFILDLIFACLFKLNYQQNVEDKLKNDQMFDHRHPYKSPINDDFDKQKSGN